MRSTRNQLKTRQLQRTDDAGAAKISATDSSGKYYGVAYQDSYGSEYYYGDTRQQGKLPACLEEDWECQRVSKDRESASILITLGLVGLVIVVVIASYCYHSIKQSYSEQQEKTRKKAVEEQVTQDAQDEENVKKVGSKSVDNKSSISIKNEERTDEQLSTRQDTKITLVSHERSRSDFDIFKTPTRQSEKPKKPVKDARSSSRSRYSEETTDHTGNDMKLFDSNSTGSLELPSEKFIASQGSKKRGMRRLTVDYPTILEDDAEGEESKKHASAAVRMPPTLCL